MTLEEGIVHAEDVARMNHEAAKHLTDEHPTQAEKCEVCAKEHRQFAEWLKELKAYKETWSKLGMWLADTRLAIAPDEFLNDVDEKHDREAQVDMIDTVSEWMDEHEVEAKQNCTDCIIDGTDACSRGAGRAVDDEICEDFIPSRSEIPNTCGDAISRREAKKALEDRFIELQKRHSENRYETNFCLNTILELPSVAPQQRTGRWKRISIDKYSEHARYWYRCDKCGKDNLGKTNFCPNCGAKMEVEE